MKHITTRELFDTYERARRAYEDIDNVFGLHRPNRLQASPETIEHLKAEKRPAVQAARAALLARLDAATPPRKKAPETRWSKRDHDRLWRLIRAYAEATAELAQEDGNKQIDSAYDRAVAKLIAFIGAPNSTAVETAP